MLEGLRLAHGAVVVVRDVDLRVLDGEWFVIAGPEGSGKSTLLRVIAGTQAPSAGRVLVGDRDVTAEPAAARGLCVVPRSADGRQGGRPGPPFGLYRLFRRASASSPAPAHEQLRAALSDTAGRPTRPPAVLADEPFAGLDPTHRSAARADLQVLHRRVRTTVIHATSDQGDALALGERVAVMIDGLIHQVGPPALLYERPATVDVAAFIGAPAMNLVAGRVVMDRGRPAFRASGRVLAPLPASAAVLEGRPVTLGVRPTDVVVSANGDGLAGSIDAVQPSGPAQMLRLTLADGWLFTAVVPARPLLAPGIERRFTLAPDRLHLFGPDGRRFLGADPPPG
jgi:ABC-type sugar transport system ATPase subunit